MIHVFCNSHYLSHFAAFFIVARTKRSIVKSCFYIIKIIFRQMNTKSLILKNVFFQKKLLTIPFRCFRILLQTQKQTLKGKTPIIF
ncbi:hypothetical protein BCR36DRAFT_79380 [Piromyces finnis]|uniref:Uncharacterized protein n=1 Tax=Piromyces finnis TaxID=1754191 RepID=A0A1Y1V6G5_9FUNG|nr:hypothetical protein BCR36DRAFT_77253 [Piromyces finnis]ORX48352.1 hypothetical protein BCR36DRAFT_79380 [Piromyces finnis]|eukprot:ORX48342.1 hypothetical protein BCR36DRAFT_77253 [Piromyces finnis]